MTLAVVDLPQPDSPTMPTVSPGISLIVTPRTALTVLGRKSEPVRVLKVTEMSSRKMIGSVVSLPFPAIYFASLRVSRYGVRPLSLR